MLAAQQCIAAIMALVSGNTDAGTNVHASRAWPLSEFPAWKVYAVSEDISALTVHYPQLRHHRLTVAMEGLAQATTDIDTPLHALRAQAITALFDTADHAGLGFAVVMNERSAAIEVLERTELITGATTVQLDIEFKTFANTPEVFA